jgi:hypothetical protein
MESPVPESLFGWRRTAAGCGRHSDDSSARALWIAVFRRSRTEQSVLAAAAN